MNEFGFGDFTFNSGTLELHRCGEEVVLRPKTAALLRVLLKKQPALLSKRDIIEAVWHSEWVSEQNLFQAMSELRRALAPLKPIKTFPNKGYQWVLPVHCSVPVTSNAPFTMHKPQLWSRVVMAAGVCAAMLFAGVMIGMSQQPSSPRRR